MVRRSEELGRRSYDHKTPWPTYVGIVSILASMWWNAAVNTTNAQQTRANVQEMQVQLAQLRETTSQLKSAVSVINCRVAITCQAEK